MSIVILGIDLGKNSCSLVGFDADGSAVVRRRMRRDGVVAIRRKTTALHDGDGSVLRRPSHGSVAGGTGARGPADVAGICAALRQGAEERRS